MLDLINCYLGCITSLNFNVQSLMLIVIALSILLPILYLIKRDGRLMIGGQNFVTLNIFLNLVFMRDCDMFVLFWIYISIVFIGVIILGGMRHRFSKWIKEAFTPPAYIRSLAKRFQVDISVLNWPRASAFTYKRRIFLSAGLLKRLEYEELKAVIAHEAYHVRSSINPIFATFIGITSLTFIRYRDELKADEFAAMVAGTENLISALIKLNVKDCRKRIKALNEIH